MAKAKTAAPATPGAIDLTETHEVIALDTGYDNVCVRQPGDTFPMRKFNADGSRHVAPWFRPVNPDESVDDLE